MEVNKRNAWLYGMQCRFKGGAALFLWLAAMACSGPPDRLDTLDLNQWRHDKRGCEGIRKNQMTDLDALKQALLGKTANEIGVLFGKPDIHQIGGRGLKTYVYFLEPGPQCQDIKGKSEALKVLFRFSAVGLLTEVNYQATMPE